MRVCVPLRCCQSIEKIRGANILQISIILAFFY